MLTPSFLEIAESDLLAHLKKGYLILACSLISVLVPNVQVDCVMANADTAPKVKESLISWAANHHLFELIKTVFYSVSFSVNNYQTKDELVLG